MAENTRKPNYPSDQRDNSPLRSLQDNENVKKYVFPKDLIKPIRGDEETHPYMNFKVAKYSRAFRTDVPKITTLATVHLPVPASLQVGYNINYNNTDLGPGASSLSRDSGFARTAQNLIRGRVLGAIGSSGDIDQAALLEAFATRFGQNIARGIGNLSGLNVFDAAQIALGKAINPHTASLFQGVNFREHNFSYRLIATNQQESDEIRKIITQFKYSMHPSFGTVLNGAANAILEYPEQWFISFSKDHRNYLYDFLPCSLTSLTVNYNGSNIPTFFENTKAPVHIEINLAFREVEIMTKETIRKEKSFQENRSNKGNRGQ